MTSEIATDYLIVGAGSAGCVLANRLSANPNNRVVLLEAGGKDWNPWIHIPVGYFKTMHNPSVDWCYKTQPDSGINGRQLEWPRGKVIGGSSSLNGLLYVRGQAQDYDNWCQLGNPGWGWNEVLPLFKKIESYQSGEDEYRGRDGELTVSDMRLRLPICDAWVEAAQAAGYSFNQDYNGAVQEGVGYFQLTAKNGYRCSSAKAFLKPVRSRPNLQVITRAHAQRVLIENKRAVGLVYNDRAGNQHTIRVTNEVILSAGAIGSPQLLMVSGVGEAEQLKNHGIEVLSNLPGIGKNLQDHLQARLIFKCYEPTLNNKVGTLYGRIGIALEYLLYRSGPMSMAASLATGYLKTSSHVATPNIQFHIQPWSADSPGEGVHPFAAFTMSVCQLRPESRGEVRITSANPSIYPEIHPNYLSTETDCRTIVEGVKVARRIAKFDPLRVKIAEEFRPDKSLAIDDYEGTLDWARNNSTTIYHPTGTCKMGKGADGVVDQRLRVRGIGGLRVADCSIMPEIVSGNTNAPAIMIGQKAANLILEDH